MKPILEVRNLWKQYKIGGQQASYLSLREKLLQPFKRQKTDTFWALQDINFDIYEGECVGIIGRNGAGKSTLLKILSQITPPTKGHIKARGRIASLLEVGTGFHPELTGRENVYLNGSILGLKRSEINAKFDEIIDFSGIGKFLDTPLKHYSSGMKLRLAFSVAAHLEPEILLIDEVLAVGDAEFQKKCLGKMDEVSKSGRTVLFVSHNLGAVKQLCTRGIFLKNGQLHFENNINKVIDEYLNLNNLENKQGIKKWNLENAPGEELKLLEVKLSNLSGDIKTDFTTDETIVLAIKYKLITDLTNMRFNFSLLTNDDQILFFTSTHKQEPNWKQTGNYNISIKIPSNLLNTGSYKIQLQAGCPYVKEVLKKITCLSFQATKIKSKSTDVEEKLPGFFAPILNWEINYEN
jgi:lipopolysaccharide transport system ATP-binding protein